MATIQMQAQKVQKAAEKVLESIQQQRLKSDESAIKAKMKKRRFVSFCGFCYPSRDQAIIWLDEKAGTLGWRSRARSHEKVVAEGLLLLAEHGDPVTLNAEDVQILFGNT